MLRKLVSSQSKGNAPVAKDKPDIPAIVSRNEGETISDANQHERFVDYQNERRASEKVQAAQAAAAAGDRVLAERLFLEAIELDRHTRPEAGSGYALGRYGAFLEEDGRSAEAICVYEEAVRVETDIPAVYGPLMALYAERNDEDAVFRIADAYAQRPRIEHRRVVEHLIRLAVGRAKAGDAAAAERWLLRIEGWASRGGDQSSRFAAWGQRGLIIERAGDTARAVACYESAVAAGTTDRTTYTRLLMAHEKSKRWAEALALAHQALSVQHDAAWEEDLRKRIARIEPRRTPANVRKSAAKTEIPPYSVRLGSDRVLLLNQVSPKLPPRHFSLSSDGHRLLVSAGSSKPDNLTLFDLATLELVWTQSVSGSSAQVLSLGSNGFAAATDHGRIGDGGAQLSWFDTSGRLQASGDLPDKLSEVRAAGDLLAAGCRDGHLYAFDARGRQRWRYRVPSRGDLPSEQPDVRPCPYFVQVSADGRRILFSSWDTVFLLDDRGKLQWTWTTPTEMTTIYGLAIALKGDRYLVTGSDGVLTTLDARGRTIRRLVASKGAGFLAATPDLARIVYAHWGGLNFYQSHGLVGVYPTERLNHLQLAPDGRHVIAWNDKSFLVLTTGGLLVARLEFARSVTDVVFVNGDEFIVAAGKLVRLRIK